VIIHGTNDWVVPLSSAKRLKPLLMNDDVFLIIDGGSHKDLRKFREYHAILSQVLK
jgi:pimeloyl-ACP methyl ester carboxylesterase